MVCDYSGFVQYYLKDAPFHQRIECIVPGSKGLIVAGVNGYMWAYECKPDIEYAL